MALTEVSTQNCCDHPIMQGLAFRRLLDLCSTQTPLGPKDIATIPRSPRGMNDRRLKRRSVQAGFARCCLPYTLQDRDRSEERPAPKSAPYGWQNGLAILSPLMDRTSQCTHFTLRLTR